MCRSGEGGECKERGGRGGGGCVRKDGRYVEEVVEVEG